MNVHEEIPKIKDFLARHKGKETNQWLKMFVEFVEGQSKPAPEKEEESNDNDDNGDAEPGSYGGTGT